MLDILYAISSYFKLCKFEHFYRGSDNKWIFAVTLNIPREVYVSHYHSHKVKGLPHLMWMFNIFKSEEFKYILTFYKNQYDTENI